MKDKLLIIITCLGFLLTGCYHSYPSYKECGHCSRDYMCHQYCQCAIDNSAFQEYSPPPPPPTKRFYKGEVNYKNDYKNGNRGW